MPPKALNDSRRTSLQLNLSEPATCNVQFDRANSDSNSNSGNWKPPDGSSGRWTGDGQWDCFVSAQVPDFYRLATAGQRRFNLCQIRIASSCPTTNTATQCMQPGDSTGSSTISIAYQVAASDDVAHPARRTANMTGLIIESKLCHCAWLLENFV